MAGKGFRWEEHLVLVLSTKPAVVVQEACQVLENHGYPVKKLMSGLYYSAVAHVDMLWFKYCIICQFYSGT